MWVSACVRVCVFVPVLYSLCTVCQRVNAAFLAMENISDRQQTTNGVCSSPRIWLNGGGMPRDEVEDANTRGYFRFDCILSSRLLRFRDSFLAKLYVLG